MEPFKALTFIAAAAAVSLVGAGAAGFYAGYTAGRGDEIRGQAAGGPAAITSGSPASVSLKPVLEDIRALSKQVEALSPARSAAVSDSSQYTKPVIDEIRSLSRQVETLKAQPAAVSSSGQPQPQAAAPDYSEEFSTIREQIRSLNTKFDKQEPKAPKALVDEIRALSASVQSQDPNVKRAVIDEIHTAVATLQNAEPRAPKAVIDEIKTISANIKAQESRASVYDQVRVLSASVEALKAKLPDSLSDDMKRINLQIQTLAERSFSGAPANDRTKGDTSINADVAQLRQLVASATDQFGKCQSQIASLTAASFSPAQQPQPTPAAVAVNQGARQEPAAVVFYDNVMLRKDQEKQYDEIGVRLSLQAVTPRQVKLAVNRQGFGLAFGERKVFRSQDVECELNLMETNLNDAQARVSISCKR